MVVCIALQCFCLGVAIVDLMMQIVLYEMFRLASKGRHEADPYGDIEMVCIVGAGLVPARDVEMILHLVKMIGEMVGRNTYSTGGYRGGCLL